VDVWGSQINFSIAQQEEETVTYRNIHNYSDRPQNTSILMWKVGDVEAPFMFAVLKISA